MIFAGLKQKKQLAWHTAIKTNQCPEKEDKEAEEVQLISEDTGPGSVGVGPRHSLLHPSAEHSWAVAASTCCRPTIFFLLRYHTHVRHPLPRRPPSPIHSFSLPFCRLTVTVCGPLTPVALLSCQRPSTKLSSCLSLGSTRGGKLERYIKTMWARLVYRVYVCVCMRGCVYIYLN